MVIGYTLGLEDHLTQLGFYYACVPKGKKAVRDTSLIFAVLFALFLTFGGLSTSGAYTRYIFMGIGILGAIGIYWIVKSTRVNSIVKQARNKLSVPEKSWMFGPEQLSLRDDGVERVNNRGLSLTYYWMIKSLYRNGHWVYVYNLDDEIMYLIDCRAFYSAQEHNAFFIRLGEKTGLDLYHIMVPAANFPVMPGLQQNTADEEDL